MTDISNFPRATVTSLMVRGDEIYLGYENGFCVKGELRGDGRIEFEGHAIVYGAALKWVDCGSVCGGCFGGGREGVVSCF